VITTTASRADGLTAPNQVAAILVRSTIKSLSQFDAPFAYCAPPDGSPFTASPIVLRV